MQGIEIPIGAPLGKLDKDLKGAKSKLNQFAGDAAKASSTLGGAVSNGSNKAAFALTNLGRVAQDAPFGFIGIQNNIPPLIESFQRLKAESGSTGGALKALAGSLVGGGGLLLAVSLVTSALTVLAQNPEKVAGALNYLSGVVDDATETQKKYNQELIATQASAKVEISTLEGLISIAKNEKLSRDARLEALKAVKAEYPEQLNFLTLETVGSKEAAKAIDLLSQSLLRKAKIQAAEKLLGEAFVKQLEATTKSATEQASTFSKVVGAALGAVGIKNFVVLQDGIENQAKAFKEAGDEINIYNNLLKQLRTQEAETGNLFNDKVETDKEKRRFFALVNDFKGIAETGKKEIAKSLTSGAPLLDISTLFGGKGFTPDNIGKQLYTPFQILQDNIKFDLLPQLGSSFKTFFDDLLMNGNLSFSALGQAIKSTFVSVLASEATQGVLKLLGSAGGKTEKGGGLLAGVFGLLKGSKKATPTIASIAASTGGFLGTGAAVGGGTTGAIGTGTVASGGALLPILAGVAAVAGIASLFKKKQQAPIPQASSTISTSAAGSSQDFGGGRVVFEISGTNLVGVLNRAGAKLQRFGP